MAIFVLNQTAFKVITASNIKSTFRVLQNVHPSFHAHNMFYPPRRPTVSGSRPFGVGFERRGEMSYTLAWNQLETQTLGDKVNDRFMMLDLRQVGEKGFVDLVEVDIAERNDNVRSQKAF